MSTTHTTRIFGGTIILAGVVGSAALALLPLPTVNALGGPVAWCGPGTTSASAIRVATRPDVVNEGGGASGTTEQRAALKEVCKGEADSRMQEAGVVGLACVVLGGGVIWLGRRGSPTTA